jgi:hypothetical protein
MKRFLSSFLLFLSLSLSARADVVRVDPENAGEGDVSLYGFQEIWQYGSDETEPWYLQDGVAPQARVGGLIDKDNKYGRAYIPEDGKHDFVQSHLIKNYKWIFEKKPRDDGYVKPRN